MPRTRNVRKMRTPIRLDEVLANPNILAAVRRVATKSGLPQTVWPTTLYGKHFVCITGLVTSIAMARDGATPHDAAPGSEALLTVLPEDYFLAREEYDEWQRLFGRDPADAHHAARGTEREA